MESDPNYSKYSPRPLAGEGLGEREMQEMESDPIFFAFCCR